MRRSLTSWRAARLACSDTSFFREIFLLP
jgi:hypothetical protein